MIEKIWEKILPQTLTSNGNSIGQIKVRSTSLFKVKQKVTLFSDNISPSEFEVKRITSKEDIEIGPIGHTIRDRSNLSLFLVSDNAKISAPEQARPTIPHEAYERAVYQEEPAVALRTIQVDELGNIYNSDNPIQTDLRRGIEMMFSPIDFSSSGDNLLVPGVIGKKIKVLHYTFVADGNVTASFKSDSTPLTGAMSFLSNGGVSSPVGNPSSGWLFETAVSEDLILNLGGAVGVRGHISYFME